MNELIVSRESEFKLNMINVIYLRIFNVSTNHSIHAAVSLPKIGYCEFGTFRDVYALKETILNQLPKYTPITMKHNIIKYIEVLYDEYMSNKLTSYLLDKNPNKGVCILN